MSRIVKQMCVRYSVCIPNGYYSGDISKSLESSSFLSFLLALCLLPLDLSNPCSWIIFFLWTCMCVTVIYRERSSLDCSLSFAFISVLLSRSKPLCVISLLFCTPLPMSSISQGPNPALIACLIHTSSHL